MVQAELRFVLKGIRSLGAIRIEISLVVLVASLISNSVCVCFVLLDLHGRDRGDVAVVLCQCPYTLPVII